MVIRKGSLSLAVVTALTGCAAMNPDPEPLPQGQEFVSWVPRNYSTQAFPVIESKQGQSEPAFGKAPNEQDQLPRPTQTWWFEFGIDELSELVESALANNYDLRVAVARIEQAERQAMIAQASRYPTIDFFSRAEIEAPSGGVGTARSRSEFRSQTTYQLGFRASYEVDLWGRIGFQSESALALARASIFNRQAVALTLTSEVTNTYLQIVSLNERILISEQNREIAQTVADAISKRVEQGDASVLDLQRQQVTIALIQNTQANLRLQRERLMNRLAVFLGKPPSAVTIRNSSLKGVKIPQVSPGLPSEMLCRRPDIRRAEAQLQAASADVNAARANLLPSISLTAEFGQGSLKLSELLQPQSLLYNAAANLVQSVFDFERKENQLATTRARNRELLDTYANTVLAALRDVEDALSGIRLTGMQQQALAEALERNSQLLAMSRRIYERGALDYVSLLDTQRDLFQAQDAEASARFEQLRASVDLFKALGGGVAAENDPCVAPPTQEPLKTSAPIVLTPEKNTTPGVTVSESEPSKSAQMPVSVPVVPDSADLKVLIEKRVQDWAKSWASRSFDQYLSFYSSEFKSDQFKTRSEWTKSRRARILGKKSIALSIEEIAVTQSDPNKLTSTFRQDYQSGSISSSTLKTLVWVKENDQWMILSETAASSNLKQD